MARLKESCLLQKKKGEEQEKKKRSRHISRVTICACVQRLFEDNAEEEGLLGVGGGSSTCDWNHRHGQGWKTWTVACAGERAKPSLGFNSPLRKL